MITCHAGAAFVSNGATGYFDPVIRRRLGLDRHLSGEPDRRDHGADPSPERRREDGPLRYLCLSERGDPVERGPPPATRLVNNS